jgi:hypothetical protein
MTARNSAKAMLVRAGDVVPATDLPVMPSFAKVSGRFVVPTKAKTNCLT